MNKQQKISKGIQIIICVFILLACNSKHLKAQCSIENLSATAYCNNDDLINILYSFDIVNGNNSGYDVFIDGVFYNYFPSYPTGVATIENYASTQFTEPIEITISDNDNSTCTATTTATYSAFDCSSNDCITNVSSTLGDCNVNGTVDIEIDFEYINVQHSWFSLTCNGVVSNHNWTDLPVTCTLPGDEETYEILIKDGNEPACMDTFSQTTTYCPTLPCSISNATITSLPCVNGYTTFEIDFDYENTISDYFIVNIIGQNSVYYYDDLPIESWTVPGDGETTYDFTIYDGNNPSCTTEATVTATDCGETACTMEIANLEVGCNGYIPYVYFDMISDDTATSYNFYANGNLISTYSFGSPGFNINLFNVSGTVTLEWQGSINCFYETTIEIPPACAEYCNFQITSIETYCNFDTQFVDFEITTQNVGPNGFEVYYDNTSLGTYQYGEPSYSIPLPYGIYSDQIFLYDVDSTDCVASYDVIPLNCNACTIGVNNLEAGCDGNVITLTYWLTSNQDIIDYDVFIDGTFIATINFIDGALQTIYLNGITEIGNYTFTIEGDGDCFHESIITIQDDCSEVCELGVPIVESYCNNGIAYVDFEVDYNNTNNIGFDVLIDGIFIDSFEYGESYYTIELPEDINIYALWIYDIDNDGCNWGADIPLIDCTENCDIQITNIESYCDQGNQFIEFEIETVNVGSSGFQVFLENDFMGIEFLGEFEYGLSTYSVANNTFNLLSDGINSTDIILVDIENSNCTASMPVSPQICSDCSFEINNFEIGCITDTPYVSFTITSFNGPSTIVLNTGANGPTTSYDYDVNTNLTVLLPGYESGGYDTWIFDTVQNCGTSVFGMLIYDDCQGYCTSYLSAVESYCDNGIVYAEFEVNNYNPGSSGFEVQIDGTPIDTLEYGETFYNVELPDNIINSSYGLWIYDLDSINCSSGPRWFEVDCLVDCPFENLTVETNCDDYDGTFNYTVNFDPQNGSSYGFTVNGNGNNYGTFSYTDLPITFGNLAGDGITDLELEITDIDNQDCSIVWEGDPVECITGGQCFISDVSISNECSDDDEIFLSLDFIAQNNLNYGFDVWINSVFIDSYQYTELPLELGPLVADGLTPYLIEFADIADPNCIGSVDLQELSCVWAGDADFNKVVNNYDLLNIGLAYGYSGPSRINADINFDAEPAESWTSSYADGINHKHADCNGNGEVTNLDVDAINQNYGLMYGKTNNGNTGSEDDPPLYIDLPEGSLVGGTELEIPIVLGSIDFPVDSIYGLAFTIEYNPNIIDSTSVEVMFGDSWFAPESLQINLTKEIETGFVDAAISRIDHLNVTGSGEIGVMSLVLLENIEGKTTIPLQIEITNVKAIRHSEDEITLNTNAESVEVINNISTSLPNSINIYPNPASDYLFVNSAQNIELSIFNSEGKLLINENSKNLNQVDISHLETGVYLLKLENQSANYFEKLIIR